MFDWGYLQAHAAWTDVPLSEVTIGPQIGSGGFAVVHKGEWRGKPVAIKALVCVRPSTRACLTHGAAYLCALVLMQYPHCHTRLPV